MSSESRCRMYIDRHLHPHHRKLTMPLSPDIRAVMHYRHAHMPRPDIANKAMGNSRMHLLDTSIAHKPGAVAPQLVSPYVAGTVYVPHSV